jgi:hypothetical protein
MTNNVIEDEVYMSKGFGYVSPTPDICMSTHEDKKVIIDKKVETCCFTQNQNPVIGG